MKDFLRQWYEEKGPRWCANQLGANYESVKQMAHVLRLSFRNMKRERMKSYLQTNLLTKGWSECAKETGIPESTIRKWAKKLSLEEPPDGRGADPYPFTDKQKKFIRMSYPQQSTSQIASVVGSSNDAVISFLQRDGIYIGYDRRAGSCFKSGFFEWSNDLAYVFGYMCADGSIGDYQHKDIDGRKARSLSQSSVASKDKQILEDIKKKMGLKAKICSYQVDGETYHCLTTNCRRVFDEWRKMGLRQRKSFVGIGIPDMPEEYVRHFVRGFFDGDGGLSEKKRFQLSFGCTDREFISWIASLESKMSGQKSYSISLNKRTKTPFYFFAMCSHRAEAFREWMAPGSGDLRLDRKWKSFVWKAA